MRSVWAYEGEEKSEKRKSTLTAKTPETEKGARRRRRPLQRRVGLKVTSAPGSDAEDHDFGGFDQSGDAFAGLEAHFLRGVGGDDGGDMLLADGEGDLREQAAVFDGGDAADELVASADFAEIATAGGGFAAVQGGRNEAVDFGFGDAVVAAGGFRSFEFAAVDPLFQRGIADAEDVGGFAWGEESLHKDEDRRF